MVTSTYDYGTMTYALVVIQVTLKVLTIYPMDDFCVTLLSLAEKNQVNTPVDATLTLVLTKALKLCSTKPLAVDGGDGGDGGDDNCPLLRRAFLLPFRLHRSRLDSTHGKRKESLGQSK